MRKPDTKTRLAAISKDTLRDLPAYGLDEAAHYLALPAATLRSWVRGRHYPTTAGKKWFRPPIALPDATLPQLSFNNLVEAHVLSALRREQRVPLPAIRKALDSLSARTATPRPLIDGQFATDGAALFVDDVCGLIDASADGQLVLREVLEAHLRRIDRDRQGFPERLYPFTRPADWQAPKSIVIDPRISFGRPVLRGTRIPTAAIAERYKAGDSIDELVADYGRTRTEIEEAIRCEFPREAA